MTELPARSSGFDMVVSASLQHPLVVIFPKTRSASYAAAVNLAQQAVLYSETDVGGALFHVAGFSADKDQAARALSLVRFMHSIKGFQIYAGGKQLQDWPRVETVLACYLEASACKDPRAHCQMVVHAEHLVERYYSSRPSGGVSLDLDWMKSNAVDGGVVVFPCRYLLSRNFRFQVGHPSSLEDQMQAGAVREGCDWCPNFKPTELRQT